MCTQHQLLVPSLCAGLLLFACPALGAPPRGSAKARPDYYLVVKIPQLERGLDPSHGAVLTTNVRARLARSAALSMPDRANRTLPRATIKRHLRRSRLAGMATVPKASCTSIKGKGDKTVVRCQVSLLLTTLLRNNIVSATSCEAEVSSFQPAMQPADLRRLQRDVLALAADGAAEDLAAHLERTPPGTGRMPRRGR